MPPGAGTAINVATIIGGTLLGLLVGHRLPERVRTTALQAVGIVVIAIGVGDVVGSHNVVFPLVSVVAGGVVGELLRLEDRLESLGEWLRRKVARGESKSRFVEGFVDATLIYVVGPLAILGAIADGLDGEVELLVVKSALDGLVSIVFAASLGIGVAFSALPVAVYQGVITALASVLDDVLDERMVLEMTATGGVLVIGIGLRLLELVKVRVGSLLPALLICPVLVAAFAR